MLGGEGKIMKERLLGKVLSVFLQYTNGMIGGGAIKVATKLHSWQFCVVLIVYLWIEEAALIFKVVGTIKASLQRHPFKVPFAGMVGSVA